MKLWRFYKKPTEEQKKYDKGELDIKIKYPLYAVTTNKKLAETFRKSRNMDLFIEKCSKITKEESNDYMRTHNYAVLDMYRLNTYKDKNTVNQTPLMASVCITRSEFDHIEEATDTGGIINLISSWIPVSIFEDEIQDILRLIGYEKAQMFAYQGELPFDPDTSYSPISYYDLDFEFDTFGVFMILYESTFSEHFSEYVEMEEFIY